MVCGKSGMGLAALLAIGGKAVGFDPATSQIPDLLTKCPECGWEVALDFSWCPKCGFRLSPYQCEYCRSMVPKALDECAHCGAPIDK